MFFFFNSEKKRKNFWSINWFLNTYLKLRISYQKWDFNEKKNEFFPIINYKIHFVKKKIFLLIFEKNLFLFKFFNFPAHPPHHFSLISKHTRSSARKSSKLALFWNEPSLFPVEWLPFCKLFDNFGFSKKKFWHREKLFSFFKFYEYPMFFFWNRCFFMKSYF